MLKFNLIYKLSHTSLYTIDITEKYKLDIQILKHNNKIHHIYLDSYIEPEDQRLAPEHKRIAKIEIKDTQPNNQFLIIIESDSYSKTIKASKHTIRNMIIAIIRKHIESIELLLNHND